MYKALLAVIAAAACAAALVGFVPPTGPALAAVQAAQRDVIHTAKSEALARGVDIRSAGCVQAWPYYEPSCLHDSRRQDGSAGAVRVIAASKPAPDRIRQAQR